MTHLARKVRQVATALLLSALGILVIAPASVDASTVLFVGNVGYTTSGQTATLTADSIQNFDLAGVSGGLRMELWALNAPYTGGQFNGFPLAQYNVAGIPGGASVSNVNSGSIPFTMPPPGTWTFTIFLTEYAGSDFDNGYVVKDARNFSPPVVVPSSPPTVIPQAGFWWNPDESGSGYNLDYQNGQLVVAVYSYLQGGSAQWYLAAGPLSGTTFTAFLTKYVGGQCISCVYAGRPTPAGDDGTVTIIFSSPTAATMYLPNGRITQIQRELF